MKAKWLKWLMPVVFLTTVGCSGRAALEVAAKSTQASLSTEPASSQAQKVVIPANSPQLSRIRVEAVELASVPSGSTSAPSKIEANANRLSRVVLPVAGRVTKVLVKLGDSVQKGQPLLTLESPDIESAVSAFQQARSAITQAESVQTKAQSDLDRAKDLFEHAAIAQKEVFNYQALLVQAQTSLAQAHAAAAQARRRLQLLDLEPDAFGQQVTLRAPISGKVLELSVVNGEFRNDLSAPLMIIADLSLVWVASDVPETLIGQVRIGSLVTLALAAYPADTFRSRVLRIGDVVDPQTRTVKVISELPNVNGRLKPEMFGQIQLSDGSSVRPTIPAGALIATEGKTMVWRQASPGAFEKISVIAGTQLGNRIAILSGLGTKDRIVTDGVMLLGAR